MAKQEITQKKIDGQVEEMVFTTSGESIDSNLEDCTSMLFPQKGETLPRLRFKGFAGEWEKKRLSDCLEISEEKNTDNAFGIDDVLSVSDEHGIINQIEYLGRSYAGKSVRDYRILRPGQIVYTKSPLRAKPYGIVKENTGKAGIVSVLYAVYNPKEGIAPKYIHYYFDPAWRLNAYMRPLVNKGAKNTMNISDETALTGFILIPKDFEEQRHIASFFSRLDAQITLHQQQLERLKQMKTACLHSMFPQIGEDIPQIRFKGFEGEWIEDKIGNITFSYSGGTPTAGNAEYYGGDIPFIRSGEIHLETTELFLTQKGINSSAAKYVSKGTVLYALYGATSGEVDVSKINGAINQAILAIIPQNGMSSEYLSYLLQSRKDDIVGKYIQGGQGNLSAALLKSYSIRYPKDTSEQIRIVSFFVGLDKKISLQTQQIEKLKQIKSACLNKMIA